MHTSVLGDNTKQREEGVSDNTKPRYGRRLIPQPCNLAKSPLNLTGMQEITSKQVSKFSEAFY